MATQLIIHGYVWINVDIDSKGVLKVAIFKEKKYLSQNSAIPIIQVYQPSVQVDTVQL